MKVLITSFAVYLISFSPSFGCLNGETLILKNGTFVYEDSHSIMPHGHEFSSEEELKSGLEELDSLYTATNDLDYLSDKGILLILLRRYPEAISLYLNIERKQADRYSTAANLGTAYELAGDDTNALKWIKKAIKIDPSSHFNSEWIHANILDAKIKGESYFTTKALLNLDFGDGENPVSDVSKDHLESLVKALYYQLNERMSFIKPKDKVVAQLLFDMGNAELILNDYENALSLYHKAEEYGLDNPLLEKRRSLAANFTNHRTFTLTEVSDNQSEKKSDKSILIIAMSVVVVCGFFVYRLTRG